MFGIPIEKILGGLVGLGLGVGLVIKIIRDFSAWKKEKAARERGLPGNPIRCENHEKSISDHDSRIRKMEGLCERFDERFKNVQEDINDIKHALERAPWAK